MQEESFINYQKQLYCLIGRKVVGIHHISDGILYLSNHSSFDDIENFAEKNPLGNLKNILFDNKDVVLLFSDYSLRMKKSEYGLFELKRVIKIEEEKYYIHDRLQEDGQNFEHTEIKEQTY